MQSQLLLYISHQENYGTHTLAYGLHAPSLGMNYQTYGPVRFKKDPKPFFNDFYNEIECLAPDKNSKNKELYKRAPDYFILTVFILAGPLTAGYMYFHYSFLLNPGTGVAVIAGLAGIALYSHKKRHKESISDPLAIILLGGVLPACIMGVFFSTHLHASMDNLISMVIVFTYFLIETLMIATLFIRNKPVLTLPGVMGLLFISIAANLSARFIGRYAGLIFIGAAALAWATWGRKHLAKYFRVHGSFWMLQAVLIASFYLLMRSAIPFWLNISVVVILSGALIGWAYRKEIV